MNRTTLSCARRAGPFLVQQENGHGGRLRLKGPESIHSREAKRLQKLDIKPIVFEGVQYTPMELSEAGAGELLKGWD